MDNLEGLLFDFENFASRIKRALHTHPPGVEAQKKMAPFGRSLRPEPGTRTHQAAVMAPFFPTSEGIALLFTLRPMSLAYHPGEVSFPGGRFEEGDQSLVRTALREAEEELGIQSEHVRILGALSSLYVSPGCNCVFPFVGWLPTLPPLRPSQNEVKKVLSIPVATLLDPQSLGVHVGRYQGSRFEAPCYVVDGHHIWGATAMMVSELLSIVASLPNSTKPQRAQSRSEIGSDGPPWQRAE